MFTFFKKPEPTTTMPSFTLRKTSMISGKVHSMEIPMDPDEFDVAHDKWAAGELIQNAFPTLLPEVREFIKTGVTPEEWDAMLNLE